MIINLGPDCEIAGILQRYNILELRSPFDSVITSHYSLCSCLKDKFQKATMNQKRKMLRMEYASLLNALSVILMSIKIF